jgi:hypothetical protein
LAISLAINSFHRCHHLRHWAILSDAPMTRGWVRHHRVRPLLARPGLDTAVAAALRAAFAADDPALVADARKSDLELNFVAGEEVQALVERCIARRRT